MLPEGPAPLKRTPELSRARCCLANQACLRASQDVEDTGDGGAVLHFGRRSDDLAARLAAVVVHIYTPPPVVDSARKLPALSPTMEVTHQARSRIRSSGVPAGTAVSERGKHVMQTASRRALSPVQGVTWQAKLVRAALEDALAALKQHHPGEFTLLHTVCQGYLLVFGARASVTACCTSEHQLCCHRVRRRISAEQDGSVRRRAEQQAGAAHAARAALPGEDHRRRAFLMVFALLSHVLT